MAEGKIVAMQLATGGESRKRDSCVFPGERMEGMFMKEGLKKEIYQMTQEELFHIMGTDGEGLSEEKATKIREEKGENRLSESKRKSVGQVFFEQFCDLLVIILIVAAVISMLSGNVESTIVLH